MKQINIEISEKQKEYLDSHPEINNAGLIRKLLDEYIKSDGDSNE